MEETDMFMTQKRQNHDVYQNGEDYYTTLQKAITVRKCKTLQKRQQLKMAIETLKKYGNDLKVAQNERKSLEKELVSVSNQKSMAMMNMNVIKGSRASLETVLCDLTNKVSAEEAETKRKKEEFRFDVKDLEQTWEEYKKVYEDLPLAKKRRELNVNVKAIEIERKRTLAEIEDLKKSIRTRKDIAEKRFHNWGVNLATLYFKIQHAKKIQSSLTIKKRDLDQKFVKLKEIEKNTQNSNQVPEICNSAPERNESSLLEKNQAAPTPKKFTFEMPQVTSPTRDQGVKIGEVNQTSGASLYGSWGSLLGSGSGRLASIRESILSRAGVRRPGTENKTLTTTGANKLHPKTLTTLATAKTTDRTNALTSLHSKTLKTTVARTAETNIQPQNQSNTVTTNPHDMILATPGETNLPNNTLKKNPTNINISQGQTNQNANPVNKDKENLQNMSTDVGRGEKRKNASVSDKTSNVKNNEYVPVSKKVMSSKMPQSRENLTTNKFTASEMAFKNKTAVADGLKEKRKEFNNKENITSSESSNIQRLLSNITSRMKNPSVSRHIPAPNPASIAKNNAPRNQPDPVRTLKPGLNQVREVPKISEELTHPVTNTEQNKTLHKNVEQDMFESSQRQPDYALMDPTSPPDIIPVENNSQGLSQGNSQQHSGKYSDFTSPVELDEAAKLAYQRIAAESPEFVYPRGPKPGASSEDVVRSQYFTNVESPEESLNTPTMNMSGEHQQQQQLPFSPLPIDYQLLNTTVYSPPNPTLGSATSNTNSPQMPPFGNNKQQESEKQSGGVFGFNFMPGGNQKQSSIFSMF